MTGRIKRCAWVSTRTREIDPTYYCNVSSDHSLIYSRTKARFQATTKTHKQKMVLTQILNLESSSLFYSTSHIYTIIYYVFDKLWNFEEREREKRDDFPCAVFPVILLG
jgi:hypothetical protein